MVKCCDAMPALKISLRGGGGGGGGLQHKISIFSEWGKGIVLLYEEPLC